MARARTAAAKDERRQVLLQAALGEFFDRGFAAARMDDIARRADLSKGTLYLYFSSKDDLFTSLIEQIAMPNVERVEAIVQTSASAIDAISAITQIAPVIIRETDLPKILKVLIADAPAFPDTVTAYRQNVIERVLGLMAGVLQAAKENGELEIADPALTARIVVAPIVMSVIWHILFEHDPDARIDLDSLFSLHLRMLTRALGAESEAS